ncbi:MAG: glycerophosphodiester phosphodiesterase [Candidatus Thiodiazotropha sp. (ex Dulcina madagascariensis)]|nr:glycerophosphodiester phosphodiesterase [Candidatus Thiodiazotropha sp. (ex Dulcina madagascariensis)]
MRKVVLSISLCLIVFLLFQYFYAGSPHRLPRKDFVEVIAHRGVHQTFHKENLDNHTCTASRIYKPTHNYLENTIESIQAAFEYGATMVEIDIRPTKDKHLVVFHDYGLECRTDGKGKIWDHSLDEIRKLDIGYGYTYDGGKTYPFRGKGVGKIKTLSEILNYFPDKRFLINNKSGNNLEVAQLIVEILLTIPEGQRKNIFLWTGDEAYDHIRKIVPSITRLLLPRHHQKNFFKSHIFGFGLGDIGEQYRNQGLGLPVKYTKLLWGWPYRFLDKLYTADARFYLYVNTINEFDQVSGIPLNGIITDHIEVLGDYVNSHLTNAK